MALIPNDGAAVVRAAQQLVAQHASVTSGTCAMLWQRPDESSSRYADRVAKARQRLPDNRLLLALCAPAAVASTAGVCAIELPPVTLPLFVDAARDRASYGGPRV